MAHWDDVSSRVVELLDIAMVLELELLAVKMVAVDVKVDSFSVLLCLTIDVVIKEEEVSFSVDELLDISMVLDSEAGLLAIKDVSVDAKKKVPFSVLL